MKSLCSRRTGTSSGYGKAMAELFLERGWNVLATMRRPDAGVFAHGSERLKVLPLDVTEAGSIDRAIAAGVAAFVSLRRRPPCVACRI
jgi:NAD(P)-dependent dehydrogenase (short-subunit alcohol dehydrogenase family)